METFETRHDALSMERELKGRSRARKLAHMAGDRDALRIASKDRHERKR